MSKEEMKAFMLMSHFGDKFPDNDPGPIGYDRIVKSLRCHHCADYKAGVCKGNKKFKGVDCVRCVTSGEFMVGSENYMN